MMYTVYIRARGVTFCVFVTVPPSTSTGEVATTAADRRWRSPTNHPRRFATLACGLILYLPNFSFSFLRRIRSSETEVPTVFCPERS